MTESFMSPEVRALVADEAIGIEVERFLSSSAGKALIGRLEAERADALEKLAGVDAESPKAIRAVQNQIAVIDMMMQYMADLHAMARQASERLLQIDQTD
jgi:hypothetical protein